SAAAVHIRLTPAPDLVVTAIEAPAQGTAGQPIRVRWTTRNDGLGPVVPASFGVSCYLSADPSLDGDDVQLGALTASHSLPPGSERTDSLDVDLPSFASGAYYVIVRADPYNVVYEGGADFNNDARAPILIALAPPADLVVSDVQTQANAIPGEPC